MNTQVLKPDEKALKLAGELLRNAELVGMPTETVYGLAANALDGNAVEKIFKAKGRPMDNPLIVHIADISQVDNLVSVFPEKAKQLAKAFWPGALTIIMPSSSNVPFQVTAGLKTVAVRFPSHKTANKSCSTMSFCPMIALLISFLHCLILVTADLYSFDKSLISYICRRYSTVCPGCGCKQ